MNDLDLCLEVVQGHVIAASISPKLAKDLVHDFVLAIPSGRTNNFP